MLKIVDKILLNDLGATALEYGIIAALISTAIMTTVLALGVSMGEMFQALGLSFHDTLK